MLCNHFHTALNRWKMKKCNIFVNPLESMLRIIFEHCTLPWGQDVSQKFVDLIYNFTGLYFHFSHFHKFRNYDRNILLDNQSNWIKFVVRQQGLCHCKFSYGFVSLFIPWNSYYTNDLLLLYSYYFRNEITGN